MQRVLTSKQGHARHGERDRRLQVIRVHIILKSKQNRDEARYEVIGSFNIMVFTHRTRHASINEQK